MTPQGRFAELARAGDRGALVTVLEGPAAGAKLLVLPGGGREGSLGSAELDDAAVRHAEELMWAERSELRGALFVDATFPPPRLVIFGAIDIARELCSLARVSGWRPYVIDPRGFFARPDRFPDAEQVVAAWPQEGFEQIGGIDRATWIAVLTHDPKLDDAALGIALRSEAAYVGAMGSRGMQAQRHQRLLDLGLAEAEMDRLSAPIGLDLGAITPEETALSIMSEVVALRRGRDGGRLRYAAGRIHEVGAE